MKKITLCAEVLVKYNSPKGETLAIKLDDDRVKESDGLSITVTGSELPQLAELADGDHLVLTIQKVER